MSKTNTQYKIRKSESEWKNTLTAKEYYVLREKGTEPPFTGKYADHKHKGVYRCARCGNDLFSSKNKFDSGTGWPSFSAPIAKEKVELKPDMSRGMLRTEIRCSRCGGHLGHVFGDGPPPMGQRYCINSVALRFDQKQPPSAGKNR